MTTIWKCGSAKCNWRGTQAQKAHIPCAEWLGAQSIVCPDCGGSRFFWVSDDNKGIGSVPLLEKTGTP